MTVALALLLAANDQQVSLAPPPIAAGEFLKACLSGGGMAGYAPVMAGGIDLYQLSSARLLELSMWQDRSATATISWQPQPVSGTQKPPAQNTPINGSSTMAFVTTFAKLNSTGEVAWCLRLR